MSDCINSKRMTDLLRELVQANTENPPGNEYRAAKILVDFLDDHHISSEIIGDSKRPNVLVHIGKGTSDKSLMIHGHLDTVPIGNIDLWHYDPFEAKIINGRMYGRGTADMKGAIAAIAETAVCLSKDEINGDFIFVATSDEEAGSSGAQTVVDSGKLGKIDVAICAEPTDLNIGIAEKGMLWFKVKTFGKSAHGSQPELGINAIELMTQLMLKIKEIVPIQHHSILKSTTLNFGIISGGTKINIVPDYCELHIDMRLIPGQMPYEILNMLRTRLSEYFDGSTFELSEIISRPPVEIDLNHWIISELIAETNRITGKKPNIFGAPYGTDASIFEPQLKIPHVIFGPGRIEQAHQPNEYVELESVIKAAKIYYGLAKRILK